MSTACPPPPSGSGRHLPSELWLEILTFVAPATTWGAVRAVSRQLRGCGDSHVAQTLLPRFEVRATFTLGAGARHRWYDVRATVVLRYGGGGLSRLDRRYVLFRVAEVQPERTRERAMEKWRRICAEGVEGAGVEWRVRFGAGDGDGSGEGAGGSAQTWRVRFGIDEPAEFGRVVKMRELVVADQEAEGEGLWVDWREMVGGYFRRGEERMRLGEIDSLSQE